MSELPQLSVALRPCHVDEKIAYMDVAYAIEGLAFGEGDTLAQLHLVVASIPACELSELSLIHI